MVMEWCAFCGGQDSGDAKADRPGRDVASIPADDRDAAIVVGSARKWSDSDVARVRRGGGSAGDNPVSDNAELPAPEKYRSVVMPGGIGCSDKGVPLIGCV